MIKMDPNEDSDQIAALGRRDSLPAPQPTLTTTTGTERLPPPAGGAILTQDCPKTLDHGIVHKKTTITSLLHHEVALKKRQRSISSSRRAAQGSEASALAAAHG